LNYNYLRLSITKNYNRLFVGNLNLVYNAWIINSAFFITNLIKTNTNCLYSNIFLAIRKVILLINQIWQLSIKDNGFMIIL
jgi:uncharacterized protein YqhQ